MPPKPKASNRVTSGISGLDPLMEGGFIKDDVYLVTGGTGTGKTLFCAQFLYEGLKKGDNCIFFSLEEQPEDVIKDAKEIGIDFDPFIKDKKFMIEYQDPFEMADITSLVRDKIKTFGATRIVIDSTSIFGMVFKTHQDMRKKLYELIKALKGNGAVVLMTAEILEDSKSLSRYGVEEFVVDGIIVLHYLNLGGAATRNLSIRKMRRTDHGKEMYTLDISKGGIALKK